MRNGTRLLVDTSSWIEWCVFFMGAYEPEILAVLRQSVRPGRTAVDVGANIGTHTLAMAAAGARVVAFEPNPRVFTRLQTNIALNPQCKIAARATAVSDFVGRVVLYDIVTGNNEGLASLKRAPGMQPIDVPCTTLDNEHLVDVGLIKIDIEGFEAPVLAGARQLLMDQHPIIVFEYNQDRWMQAGHSLEEVRTFLASVGYSRLLMIGRHGLRPLPSIVPEFANFYAAAD
jgi:FkbM family methyltransferase